MALSEELVGPASILFTDRRRVLHRTALPSSVRDQQYSARGQECELLFDSGRSVRIDKNAKKTTLLNIALRKYGLSGP